MNQVCFKAASAVNRSFGSTLMSRETRSLASGEIFVQYGSGKSKCLVQFAEKFSLLFRDKKEEIRTKECTERFLKTTYRLLFHTLVL